MPMWTLAWPPPKVFPFLGIARGVSLFSALWFLTARAICTSRSWGLFCLQNRRVLPIHQGRGTGGRGPPGPLRFSFSVFPTDGGEVRRGGRVRVKIRGFYSGLFYFLPSFSQPNAPFCAGYLPGMDIQAFTQFFS